MALNFIDFESRSLGKKEFRVADVTRCLGLRVHRRNPWILANLRLQFQHFRPLPPTVVVDQGSEPQWARQVEELTLAHGGRYFYDDRQGLYSPSRAHNLAAALAETEFIFFADPDFMAADNLFERLIALLNSTKIGSQLDLMINLPAIHLNEAVTKSFRRAESSGGRTAILEKTRLETLFDSRLGADFVAPYSNVYLCRRDGFQLSGGYDENFAGHGSEDFEFLLRYALIMNRLPRPIRAGQDLGRPTDDAFYFSREYAGFRSLLALTSLTAETSGLAAFHLHHPIAEKSPWRLRGDRGRRLFQSRVEPYLRDRRELLSRDWLPRSENLTVWAETEAQAELLLPLRLASYRLRPERPENQAALDMARAVIKPSPEAGPQEAGAVVISPGRLPGSWRYFIEPGPGGPKEAAPLTPEEEAAAGALAETNADLPESRESGWAELIFRQCSFLAEEGPFWQFCFEGRPIVRAGRSPRLTPRGYALGRFGVMPESQWRIFKDGRCLKDYHPDFRRGGFWARPILKAENRLLEWALRGRPKKMLKYRRRRASFFLDSASRPGRLYYRVWRRLFGD